VFMSASEIRQAARFQNRYKDDDGFSRFATVVLEHGKTVEPLAYQVSDQCVALERDECLGPSKDPYMMATRVPKKGEMVPKVIYKDKALGPGQEFLADEFIVTVVVSTPQRRESIFAHADFPSGGGEKELRVQLLEHASEDYTEKLSDFSLLCYLEQLAGKALTMKICDSIRQKQGLEKAAREELDGLMVAKRII